MSGNYGEGGHGCHSKEEKFEGRKLRKKKLKIICHRKYLWTCFNPSAIGIKSKYEKGAYNDNS